jgi:hypothetical protein
MKPATPPPLPAIPAPFLRTLLLRLLMLLVLAGSVWLVWKTFQRMSLVIRKSKEKTSEVSALGNDVQRLEQRWDRDEIERIEARFQEAQAAVFSGADAYAGWTNALREQTHALNFDATITSGRTQLDTNLNPSVRLATVELRPVLGNGATNSSYERLLSFAGTLEKNKQRVDLIELSVLGNFNSVHQATAVLEVWVGQEESEGLKR